MSTTTKNPEEHTLKSALRHLKFSRRDAEAARTERNELRARVIELEAEGSVLKDTKRVLLDQLSRTADLSAEGWRLYRDAESKISELQHQIEHYEPPSPWRTDGNPTSYPVLTLAPEHLFGNTSVPNGTPDSRVVWTAKEMHRTKAHILMWMAIPEYPAIPAPSANESKA